jgi:transposase InsO family protein
MTNDDDGGRRHERWARFRFAVVGPLLAAPPSKGELGKALEELAAKTWEHPITKQRARWASSTIERWFYEARHAPVDPVAALRRKRRKDLGQVLAIGEALQAKLIAQYQAHKRWSVQLHRDNLAVVAEEDPTLGRAPSYSTVLRFLRQRGLDRRHSLGPRGSPGAARAAARLEQREVRGYEVEYVNGLWHLDLHHTKRKVALRSGELVAPILLGVLDDRSRLCCHAQWYLDETAESLVHGVCQALQKRGLPRSAYMDNGAAMEAAETRNGLERLGIVQDNTLPYSPYQNGKMEVFWAQVEGRLMQMLEGARDLTLAELNQATQAWVEMEYHRTVHSETHQTPLARYLAGPDAGRPCPGSEDLRRAFLAEVRRTQRRSDGTLAIEGVRFEVPNRYRTLRRVSVRYASWDLSRAYLLDPHSGAILCPLYPVDRERNADGQRRRLEPPAISEAPPPSGVAPLLRKLLARYAATGLPPAYLPQPEPDEDKP